MSTFNAMDWFVKNGASKKTTVKTAGLSYKLDGAPAAYTDAGLAKLAEAQEVVKVSTPRIETVGSEAKSTGNFTGREVGNLIRAVAKAEEVVEVGADVKPEAKPDNGPASRNGKLAEAPAGK